MLIRTGRLLAVCCIGLTPVACQQQPAAVPDDASAIRTPPDPADEIVVDNVDSIKAFCAHCHAFPKPESFPRDAWKGEVAQGFRLFEAAPTAGIRIPAETATVAWFQQHAPTRLVLQSELPPWETTRFQRDDASFRDSSNAVAIACLRSDSNAGGLWASDMRTGSLLFAGVNEPMRELARPIQLTHPCRITSVDLDGDGQSEILVSELGSFLPEDHQRGAVWCFSPQNNWKARPILTSVSRVSDVQAGDFDADGDLDLIVAEFGWRSTGRILALWNDGEVEGEINWVQETIDERHGTIDVPVADIDGDGRLDFVALIAQEHECVCVFLNAGDRSFKPMTLFDAGDPSFGSSGIQLVDFDLDGDWDVLHTNGDSFDDGHLKPYHGIRWLENNGRFPFVVHELAAMPGAHSAIAGDVDLDGDLDVVAASLLPPVSLSEGRNIASVVWLEQNNNGEFMPHLIEQNEADHASCALFDWDQDGDLDAVVSHFRWGEKQGQPVTLYRNRTKETPRIPD